MRDNKLPDAVTALMMAIAKGHAYVLAIESPSSDALYCDGGKVRAKQGEATHLKMLEKFARKERKARA